jgi:AraC-like DNA-binding protein
LFEAARERRFHDNVKLGKPLEKVPAAFLALAAGHRAPAERVAALSATAAGAIRGVVPHVNELRLGLTDNSERPCRISEITLVAGFSDVLHFNRLFRPRFESI